MSFLPAAPDRLAQARGARGGTEAGRPLHGLAVQARVIGALIMRELHTRYGRDNIGYLWVIIEPMTLAIAVASIHGTSGRNHYGPDIRPIPFALGGYCLFIIFRGVVTRAETTLESNRPLLYHRMVTIFDMLFARAVLEAASILCAFVVLDAGATALGLANAPADLTSMLGAFALMTWFSWSLSMLVCAGTHASRLVTRVVHPAVYIALPVSGAFFLLRWIPQPYRGWLAWSPMAQMFELFREGQFETFDSPYVHPAYMVGWCLLLTFAGMLSIRIMRRHVHLH